MTIDADLVARIDRAVAVYGAGTPILSAELAAALAPLELRADADYADFVARWGAMLRGRPRARMEQRDHRPRELRGAD